MALDSIYILGKFAACLALAASLSVTAAPVKWPGEQKVAISLSYDDALLSQLQHAIPALNRHSLKASFYLSLSSPVVQTHIQQWRQAAEQGHELGNHTLFHPCSKRMLGRDWVKSYNDLSTIPVEEMRQRLITANAFLYALDGKTQRTFTPPCFDTRAADGNYVELVRHLFVSVKGDEKLPSGFAHLYMPEEGASAKKMIAEIQRIARRAKLINVLFHGVGGDYLAVDAGEHEKLLQYLAGNEDRYWVDTYLNIIQHVNAQESAMTDNLKGTSNN